MAKNLLPKEIYVFQDRDGDETYLIANEQLDAIDDGVRVGVYRLEKVRQKKTEHALVEND